MLIYNGILISWFAVFVTAACFAGIVVSCILRLVQKKSVSDIFIVTMLAVPLGLLFGRVLYCLFSNDLLTGFSEYLNLTNGGFGLFGVMLGVFIAVVLACRFFGCGHTGEMLDCIVPGGTLAIAIGRFATRFTSSEIGYPVNFKLFTVYDVKENVYNLAIFDLDGIFEMIIFLIALFTFFYTRRIRNCHGVTSLVMLALHGTNQVVMDSMRADPLMLGINNFIKISQIIGILCCISVLVYFMVITAKKDSFSRFHMISIPIILISIVFGVLGEYRVGSTNYISKHLLMLFGMLLLDWLTLTYAFKSVALAKEETQAESESSEPLPAETETEVQPEIIPPVQRRRTFERHRSPDRNSVYRANSAYAAERTFRSDPAEKVPTPSRGFNRYHRSPEPAPIDYENLKQELDKLNL